jgi:hypothetical protein
MHSTTSSVKFENVYPLIYTHSVYTLHTFLFQNLLYTHLCVYTHQLYTQFGSILVLISILFINYLLIYIIYLLLYYILLLIFLLKLNIKTTITGHDQRFIPYKPVNTFLKSYKQTSTEVIIK